MNTTEILEAFPHPDGNILRTIDKEACENAVDQIISGGKKTVREIVDLLFEPGKGEDARPRHALHATAIRVGGPGNEKKGRLLPPIWRAPFPTTGQRQSRGSSFDSCRFAEELGKPLPSQIFWLTRMIISTNTQPRLLRPSVRKRSSISARPTHRQRELRA